jgi:hypothetical protein
MPSGNLFDVPKVARCNGGKGVRKTAEECAEEQEYLTGVFGNVLDQGIPTPQCACLIHYSQNPATYI